MADNEVSKLKLTDGNVVSLKDATSRTGIENITKQIESLQRGYVPAGTILQGLYATAPTGFLLCNGQEVAIESYPELYAIIGTLEGCQSQNEGMFKLPDLRECVMVGAGQSARAILDEDGHSHDVYALGEFKDDQLQNITGSLNSSNSDSTIDMEMTGKGAIKAKHEHHLVASNLNKSFYSWIGFDFDASRVARTGTTTHGKQIGVNYIIKY